MPNTVQFLFRFRLVLCLLFILTMLFPLVPAKAKAEPTEVPVKLTVNAERTPIRLGDQVIIEATTEKKGDTFQVWGNQDISYETVEKDGYYVSRGVLDVNFIGFERVEYQIIMYGDGVKWTGNASILIQAENNMPPVIVHVPSKITLSPTKNFEVGKRIKFTVTTPAEGGFFDQSEFRLFLNGSKDPSQKMENVRTIKKNKEYITTGYFTPTKAGDFKVQFFLQMYENEKSPLLGTGEIEFSVKESPIINVSLSPGTAYMKAGEDIYLSVVYFIDKSPDFSDRAFNWNQPNIEPIYSIYDETIGGYRYVYRFQPEKKGNYNLEVTIKMNTNGQKREGKAKAKLYVR